MCHHLKGHFAYLTSKLSQIFVNCIDVKHHFPMINETFSALLAEKFLSIVVIAFTMALEGRPRVEDESTASTRERDVVGVGVEVDAIVPASDPLVAVHAPLSL